MPVGVERAGVLTGGKEKFSAATAHRFLKCREQYVPALRRGDRKQAVVFACVAAQNTAA